MHKYLYRWAEWSRVAEIQAERAIAKKNAHKRGGAARRGR